ncbi:LADA_0A02938g1_1 [Lachancea dasiensis]|uniref:LADA_0A02938g1_1 n=1 Tax=Lachancea dasiensis TaxID=1072105 RepID=A0A1G4IMP2_9SACH|nr:LADA_0A02938g1_1 [Lachancea dasiensis]
MGLCASKEDRNESAEKHNVQKVKRTEPARSKELGSKLQKSTPGAILGGADESEKETSARRAAGLAAADRLEKSQKQFGKGDLGRKLAQERSKTLKTQLKESAESRKAEKSATLVYD